MGIIMKTVMSYDPETVDLIFYEQGRYCNPIMLLPEFLMEAFYDQMKKDKACIKKMKGGLK